MLKKLKEMGQKMIDKEIMNIPSEAQKAKALEYLERIRQGERLPKGSLFLLN